ncbi:MAG: hypothetical protein GX911_01585 [Spirochaetales bacterium]|nr:hypothetical protein [Spirochaetales bacterium]
MRLKSVVFICLFLFVSCDHNPLVERVVHVSIGEVHPWEEASHLPLWYTLVYTTKNGNRKMHLSGGVRQATVVIDRFGACAICAYPLGTLAPLGGFVRTGGSDRVVLTRKDGLLAKLLVEGNLLNPEAIASLDMDLLSALVGEAVNLDSSALLVDLLAGVTPTQSLQRLERVRYLLGGVPPGHWVCEHPSRSSFWIHFGEEIPLLLDHGATRWLSRERSLILTLVVDSATKMVFSALADAPRW